LNNDLALQGREVIPLPTPRREFRQLLGSYKLRLHNLSRFFLLGRYTLGVGIVERDLRMLERFVSTILGVMRTDTR
jgi:hypothetical protein